MSGVQSEPDLRDVLARLDLLRGARRLRMEWRAHRMEGSTLRRWTLSIFADEPPTDEGVEIDVGLTTVSGHGIHPPVRAAVECAAACMLLPARVGLAAVDDIEMQSADRIKLATRPRETV